LLHQLSAQDLRYALVEDARVQMRDGVKLAGYFSYPKNSKPVPVLFRFTSYSRAKDVEISKWVSPRRWICLADFYRNSKHGIKGLFLLMNVAINFAQILLV
jgi:predicted acyl esterase